jgi:MutS domain V
MPQAGPRAAYEAAEARHAALHDRARARNLRLATVRGFTFLAMGAGFVLWDMLDGLGARVSLYAAFALLAAFLAQIVLHRKAKRAERRHETLRALAGEGTLRIDRAWDALERSLPAPEREELPNAEGHPYASDLGVQGRASLTRLFGPVTSDPGRRTLLAWLLEPARPALAESRAEAARALRSRLDSRLELAAHGRQAPPAHPEAIERFLAWAEGDPWTLSTFGLRVASWLLPALLVLTVGADIFLGGPPLWVFVGLADFWVLRKVTARLGADFAGVSEMSAALAAYVPQMAQIAGWPMETPLLAELSARLTGNGAPAHVRLARLARLVDTVESRANLIYASLAPFLFLDVHLGVRLDRWRRAQGASAREWLAALGEVEALCALASLAHDHPGWAFPNWKPSGEARVVFEKAGHPLLAPDACVRNDVEVGPPGSFLLVTGSNMSGKSTLLRAIGTNLVLAGAGAPVCAKALTLGPVRLYTSMSIEDSLTQGISLFMAQLLRVREIVETAGVVEGDAGPVLYLLDEMLHGTNSAERRIAARAILRHLLAEGAIGAVSTHDLALADAPDLQAVAHAVHFRETVTRDEAGTQVDFDYLVRPGLAETSNALALLEAVGLAWEEEVEGS